MNATPLLKLTDVEAEYGPFRALFGVTLTGYAEHAVIHAYIDIGGVHAGHVSAQHEAILFLDDIDGR